MRNLGEEMAYRDWNKTTAACQEPIAKVKAFGHCVSEANFIRDQLAEAGKLANDILEQLTGPSPECEGENYAKDVEGGGVIGELSRIHSGSLAYLADIRRTLGQIEGMI